MKPTTTNSPRTGEEYTQELQCHVIRLAAQHAALVFALESCVSLLEYLPTAYVHRETGEPICYSPDGALAQARAALAAARNE